MKKLTGLGESMKVALLCEDSGVPQTLATTSFVLSIADGFTRAGIQVRIFGLTPRESGWCPDSLLPFESVAPWLAPPTPHADDEIDALRHALSEDTSAALTSASLPEWYLELLLLRALEEFAAGDKDLTLLVFPINHMILSRAANVAKRMGWRLIVQSCEAMSRPWIDPATRDDYTRDVATMSDGVWALSHFLADFWEGRGVPRSSIMVYPSITRVARFRVGPPPGRLSAVYLGNLQHKEIDYLLDIAAAVARSVPGFTLRIHGDAVEERRIELAETIASRGLGGVVELVRSHWAAEVSDLLADADVLLLPRSRDEFSQASFPNKLGEYLASGRPVVVTGVGDIPLYVADREDVLLVEPDDSAAFAAAVVDVLTDTELAARLGKAGRKLAERLFDSEVVARRLVEYFDSLPSKPPMKKTLQQRGAYLKALLTRRRRASR
jgi:glycosyltransferase involved in cell wall biosynthesis